MNHRPVCVKCKVELVPEKNGVGLVDMTRSDYYQLWRADLWKCPNCGLEIVAGFGQNPISKHCESDFPELLLHFTNRGTLIKCWSTPKTKEEYEESQ